MNSAQSNFEDIKILEDKLQGVQLPQELNIRAKAQIERLARVAQSACFSQEYQQTLRYLDWIVSLPWNKSTPEVLSIEHAKKTMEANHYGLVQVKERVMEYIAVASLKKEKGEKIKAPAFFLVGLVGTGKTTMAYSIAQALEYAMVVLPVPTKPTKKKAGAFIFSPFSFFNEATAMYSITRSLTCTKP